MPFNSLFPGFVKLFYTSNGHSHVSILPCDPFQAVGGAWFVNKKGVPGGFSWVNAITAFANVVKAWHNLASSFVSAELWTIASVGADPVFVEATTLAIAGTSGVAVVPFVQRGMTLRSQNGGLFRFITLETTDAANQELFPPYTSTGLAVFNHLTDNDAWVKARDNGFLVSSIRMLTKTNDALRKKYLLDA